MKIAVIIPVVAPPFVEAKALRPFSRIDGREVFLRTVELYTPRENARQRIVVVRPDDMEEMRDRFASHLAFQGVRIVGGTSDWLGCVARGLERLGEEAEAVMVHDACCPAVPYTLLDGLEEALAGTKSAAGVVPILPSRAAFADIEAAGAVTRLREHVEMSAVCEVQSPQIFRRQALVEAYQRRAADPAATFVNDAEVVMAAGHKIAAIPGSRLNMRMDADETVRLGKDLLGHLPRAKSKTPLNPFGEAEW